MRTKRSGISTCCFTRRCVSAVLSFVLPTLDTTRIYVSSSFICGAPVIYATRILFLSAGLSCTV
jgi:hypothetical protein